MKHGGRIPAATNPHETDRDSPRLAAFLRAKDDAHAAVGRHRGTSLHQRALAALAAATAFLFLSSSAPAVDAALADPRDLNGLGPS